MTVDDVRAQTGWPLACAPTVTETFPPTADALVIRRFDPDGFWIRDRG